MHAYASERVPGLKREYLWTGKEWYIRVEEERERVPGWSGNILGHSGADNLKYSTVLLLAWSESLSVRLPQKLLGPEVCDLLLEMKVLLIEMKVLLIEAEVLSDSSKNLDSSGAGSESCTVSQLSALYGFFSCYMKESILSFVTNIN